jgi:hypothetical protein
MPESHPWLISNEFFERANISPNDLCRQASLLLSEFDSELSFYIRGSLVEESDPHPQADLDLIAVCDSRWRSRGLAPQVVERLSVLGKAVDLQLVDLPLLSVHIPQRLLLCCRGLHIAGRTFKIPPVRFDRAMVDAHWQVYNPEFAPDVMEHSPRSRVCAMKNLTRCVGLIMLTNEGRFTRHIQTCVDYASAVDSSLYESLMEMWAIVDERRPLHLKTIKGILRKQRSYFERG